MSVVNPPNTWLGTLTAMFCAETEDAFWIVVTEPADIVKILPWNQGVPVEKFPQACEVEHVTTELEPAGGVIP